MKFGIPQRRDDTVFVRLCIAGTMPQYMPSSSPIRPSKDASGGLLFSTSMFFFPLLCRVFPSRGLVTRMEKKKQIKPKEQLYSC